MPAMKTFGKKNECKLMLREISIQTLKIKNLKMLIGSEVKHMVRFPLFMSRR